MARYILNETSYFGIGSRAELANEVKARGYKKALLVSDKILASCGVLDKVKGRFSIWSCWSQNGNRRTPWPSAFRMSPQTFIGRSFNC